MPGKSTAGNLFGPSPWVVDPVGGNGATYTTIQSAIDDCALAGGGTVVVHPGTYNENLTLKSNADLLGMCQDGRIPDSVCVLNGNHTYVGPGSVIIQNMQLNTVAGDLFTFGDTTGAISILAAKFCAGTVVGSIANVATVGAGFSVFAVFESQIASAGDCFVIGASSLLNLVLCSIVSTGAKGAVLNGPGSQIMSESSRILSSGDCIELSDATAVVQLERSTFITSTGGCINFVAAATAKAADCVFDGASGSGNYIIGTGTYQYAGDVVINIDTAIAGTITQVPYVWRPFATAGTTGTAVRGTAAFDSTYFTVVDGFVAPISVAPIPWVDQAAPITVTANQGNFSTASVALTLPAAPTQGNECAFANKFGASLTVTANGTQKINVAGTLSAAGGTAVSAVAGESLTLVYSSNDTTWYAKSVTGTWNIT